METNSFKSLALRHLKGNLLGNSKETSGFHQETFKETSISSTLSVATADSYPFKAWLDDDGLRTIGVSDDLAAEIIRLTPDNTTLQAQLLKKHCGRYTGPYWQALVEKWEERAAIIQFDGGMSKEEAEVEAAKLYRLEAFLPELKKETTPCT